jgi:hypothetical protein
MMAIAARAEGGVGSAQGDGLQDMDHRAGCLKLKELSVRLDRPDLAQGRSTVAGAAV